MTKTRSIPVSHAEMAAERLEKMTSPCTRASAGRPPAGSGQSAPKPMLSSLIVPSTNSAYGSVTKAYFSPAGGAARGVRA